MLNDCDQTMSLKNSAKEHKTNSGARQKKILMYKNINCKSVYVKKFEYSI